MRISYDTAKECFPQALYILENNVAECHKEFLDSDSAIEYYLDNGILSVVLLSSPMIKLRWHGFTFIWECVWVC